MTETEVAWFIDSLPSREATQEGLHSQWKTNVICWFFGGVLKKHSEVPEEFLGPCQPMPEKKNCPISTPNVRADSQNGTRSNEQSIAQPARMG